MFVVDTVYTVTISDTVQAVNRNSKKMTKPSITDTKAVDKKEDTDIIRGERIGSGRLHTDGLPFLLPSG